MARMLLKFLGAASLTTALIWVLNHSFTVGGQALPPIGKFLNPFTGIWQNTPLPIPKAFLPVSSPYLKGEVTVYYDDRQVPHIFADSTEDAFFAQGYIHARNRLFQMDFTTRAAAGRLSEVVGSKALDFDREQRRIGMPWAARTAANEWVKDPISYTILKSYVAGVNAYISQLKPKDYPLEYKLIGFDPEPWSIYKTALFYKSMAKSLSFKESDVQMTRLREIFGESAVQELFPHYIEEQTPVVPNEYLHKFTPVTGKFSLPGNPPALPSGGRVPAQPDAGLGSNNWAVSGSKTASGKPILCGDPHLMRTLPAIWFEQQITTPSINAYGVTFPGIPGIVIGFNNHVAWTMTNMGNDVKDWYKIQWTDSTRTAYLLDGKATRAELVVEEFIVKGVLDTIRDTIRYTVWGPVSYDRDTGAMRDLAMLWLAHQKGTGRELQTFVKLMLARNVRDLRNAVTNFNSPGQNFVFATVDGDIGAQLSGAIPIKQKDQGLYVQDGSKSTAGWGGFVPFDQLPYMINPKRGFVFSANQHSTGNAYPYYYNSNSFDFSRARKIFKLLSNMDSITVDDMKAMQNDAYSQVADDLLTAMLKQVDTSRLNAQSLPIYNQLKQWNRVFNKDRIEPVFFMTWLDNLRKATWDEMLNHKDSATLTLPDDFILARLIDKRPQSPWFDMKDSPEKETARDLVTTTLNNVVADVAQQLTKNPKLNWAGFNAVSAKHLARIEGFSRNNIQTDGTKQSINANSSDWGPSWRMIVSLTRPVAAWVVYPGGQSGDPGSADYDKFLGTWAEGKYYQANFMQEKPDPKDPLSKLVQKFSKSKN